MNKGAYREWLRSIMRYVKVSKLSMEYGIPKSTLSWFMKNESYDILISVEKLAGLRNYILDKMDEINIP